MKTEVTFEWPNLTELFDEIENIEIENKPIRMFYKTFFTFFRFPEKISRKLFHTVF